MTKMVIEKVPDIHDHGVESPSKKHAWGPNPHAWSALPAEHQKKLLSEYARFGGKWARYFLDDMLRGAPVPPAVQEQADKLRAQFLKHPRRDSFLGDFPGTGTGE